MPHGRKHNEARVIREQAAYAPDLEEDEVLSAGVVKDLPAGLPAVAAATEAHDLAQEAEVGLVSHQRQHDEVSVQAVHAMAQVWLVPWAALGQPHILHYLVLTLPGHVVACNVQESSSG